MEDSHRKLSAAVVLLLLTMAGEMGPAEAKECFSESTTFKGVCFVSKKCNDKCLQESKSYSGGKCATMFLTCMCITPCTTMLQRQRPAAMAAQMDQSGGDGFLNK
ncbi:hypothetical protein BDA96_01G334800 [Sorghum bicolor]|uniref:Knottins-like domain-containing protein n=2 Tax=Sorghum bicolor TaxID=4558 RepID=A0A921S308_SORBI|nr:hypothetical protein BDA96_01G334800 [Sorghum bicolor]OQU92220.1 hypothetical protein SORBI_3001G312100 [Sorghum bicolor]